MKLLVYKAEAKAEDRKVEAAWQDLVTAEVLRELKRAVAEFDYLVRGGWRMMMSDTVWGANRGLREIGLALDMQSDCGTGSFAEAKMQTLQNFQDMALTRPMEKRELIYTVERILLARTDLSSDADKAALEMLRECEDVSVIPEEGWKWMRDRLRLAPCYGGIRVPYEQIVLDGKKPRTVGGELKVVFSGASEEQDLMFAFRVLRAVQRACEWNLPARQISYDFGRLRADPVARMWMDLLRIREE